MIDSINIMKTVAAAALATLAWTAPAAVYFGYGHVGGGGEYGLISYQDLSNQGRFFATSDYGLTPSGEDQLTAAKLGLTKAWSSNPYTRGQGSNSTRRLEPSCASIPWLSDGGDCLFGLTFDAPFKPTWYFEPAKQFASMTDKTPRFDRAVVHWGRLVPKPGTWGVCVLDTEGNYKRIEVDGKQPLYPFDQTIISFPTTTVKTLSFGLKGNKDNFVEVRQLSLLLHNQPLLDNHLMVDQPDAYCVTYSPENPGAVEGMGLQVENYYFGKFAHMLSGMSPFVELGGKRVYADKGDYPVTTQTKGRTETLRYQLRFAKATVEVTAVFGVELKDTIKFEFKASGLPKGARLGFEMFGGADLFANYLDAAAPGELLGKRQTFQTPAGPFGVGLDGADKLALNRQGERVRLDALAEDDELAVSLSLPIGPESGVQPGMLNYNWRPSLAGQGDKDVAPFSMKDLELLETVNLGDPNDPHAVFDITNDPLIEKWRKGGATTPSPFGTLNFLNEPEKGKVPLTTVLGQKCRVIGRNDTTYFRFNLQTRFEPRVPYLVVVEHAFDQERRGEFHCVPLTPDGSLWGNPCPFGGFDTGKGPYTGSFKRESVFAFRYGPASCDAKTTISLCFSNGGRNTYFRNNKDIPEGLAVKSVSVYRVTHLPELPDLEPLLPEGARRHVTMDSENANPWMLGQFPRLYGYDSLWTHFQPVSQFLHGDNYSVFRPGWQSWCHAGTLEGNRWLYEAAARKQVAVNINLGWLLDLGFEGTSHDSFLGVGWVPGDWGTMMGGLPLSPTPEELAHIGKALDRSLAVLARYPSLKDVSVNNFPAFSKRNLDDFSRDTGVPFASSPAPLENLKRLLASPQSSVDAWMKWSCQKSFEFHSWTLEKMRSHRPDLYLTINQSWYINGLQACYYGDKWPFDTAGLKAKGIDSYVKFLKFMGVDPALYAEGDGFAFGMEMDPISGMANVGGAQGAWPFEGSGPLIRDGFGGGLSVSSGSWDEGPKPMQGWGCTCMKDQRGFRKDFIDALLQGNAREYIFQTYSHDPVRGRLNDLRELAVPFRLLPFAKPEPYAGKISDTAKRAVIHKYGDRHALVNPGDRPTDVTLTLPESMASVVDLSNGVRQPLQVANRTLVLHLEPWSLKTLEIK